MLIKSIRSYEDRYERWGGYEALGRSFREFVELHPDLNSHFPGDAAMDIMRGKRDNLKDEQRRVVLRYLKSENLNVSLDDSAEIQIVDASSTETSLVPGTYYLFHHEQPTNVGESSLITCKELVISADGTPEHSSPPLLSESIEVLNSAETAALTIKRNRNELFTVFSESSERLPRAYAVIFESAKDTTIFSGLCLLVRSGAKTVSATRVVGLPSNWFPELSGSVEASKIGARAFARLITMLSGRNALDGAHMINCGFEFIDENKIAQELIGEARQLEKEIRF